MNEGRIQRRFRRPLVLLAGLLAMTMAIPGAALADEPETSTFVLVHEDEPNPCDPTVLQTVTITFTIKTHEHNNNIVRVTKTEVTTDDGYVGKGNQHDVFVNGVRRTTVKHILHNPDTGERFSVTVRFWMDLETGEFVKGSGAPTFDCIRAA